MMNREPEEQKTRARFGGIPLLIKSPPHPSGARPRAPCSHTSTFNASHRFYWATQPQ